MQQQLPDLNSLLCQKPCQHIFEIGRHRDLPIEGAELPEAAVIQQDDHGVGGIGRRCYGLRKLGLGRLLYRALYLALETVIGTRENCWRAGSLSGGSGFGRMTGRAIESVGALVSCRPFFARP